MAIGVLRAARELGLRVPDDVSVVGFDDIDISQHTNPPLTTVHQPIRRKGETAVRLLLAMIEGRERRPAPARLETRLIIRESPPAARRRGGGPMSARPGRAATTRTHVAGAP